MEVLQCVAFWGCLTEIGFEFVVGGIGNSLVLIYSRECLLIGF